MPEVSLAVLGRALGSDKEPRSNTSAEARPTFVLRARRRLGRWKRWFRTQWRRLVHGRPTRSADVTQVVVRSLNWEQVAIESESGSPASEYHLDDPEAQFTIENGELLIRLTDAAAFARLAESGLLRGCINALEVRLDWLPDWLSAGARPTAFASRLADFSWRRHGHAVQIRMAWQRPLEVENALGQVLTSVLRVRLWDQVCGPIFAVDRTAWLSGHSSWPQASLVGQPPIARQDDLGRPLGPFLTPPRAAGAERTPILSALANPYGRVMTGTAKRYTLKADSDQLALTADNGHEMLTITPSRTPEAAVLAEKFSKFAVIKVDEALPLNPFTEHALRVLAACGLVFSTSHARLRGELQSLGLTVVNDSVTVGDLQGYALSVAASRRMAVYGDAALRRTALAGTDTVPIPAVTVVVASKRAGDVEECLRHLSDQTYPSLEVVLGTHGYVVDDKTRSRWNSFFPHPLRVESLPETLTLGMALGRLSRIADGELVTKVDDDDHYGPNHVTDLFLAWHQSGADLVAKGARFVHFPDHGKTIDRTWAATETFNVTPAGGTLFLARSTLQQVGGWTMSSRHVDADLTTRVRAQGGLTYRTHSLEYVYVRRDSGHTWSTRIDDLIKQSERVYTGLPIEITRPVDIARTTNSP